MTTKAYFCCNPTDDTLIFYDSAEEAEEAARHAIEHATDGDWHPEVFGICWGRVHGSADVDVLHQHGPGSACVEAGGDGHGLCSAGVPLDADYGGEVTLHAHPVDAPPSARIAALEAEVARLRAEAVEARAVEAAAVVAWLRAELPPPHLFDPYEKGDVALEFAANEIERGSHRAGAGGAR